MTEEKVQDFVNLIKNIFHSLTTPDPQIRENLSLMK